MTIQLDRKEERQLLKYGYTRRLEENGLDKKCLLAHRRQRVVRKEYNSKSWLQQRLLEENWENKEGRVHLGCDKRNTPHTSHQPTHRAHARALTNMHI